MDPRDKPEDDELEGCESKQRRCAIGEVVANDNKLIRSIR